MDHKYIYVFKVTNVNFTCSYIIFLSLSFLLLFLVAPVYSPRVTGNCLLASHSLVCIYKLEVLEREALKLTLKAEIHIPKLEQSKDWGTCLSHYDLHEFMGRPIICIDLGLVWVLWLASVDWKRS